MSVREWLDSSRVWSSTSDALLNTIVSLRPLHHRELPGFLAIRFHHYFIEFRVPSGWDAALDDPVVLVHTLDIADHQPTSYLVSDNNGELAFGAGSFIGTPKDMSVLGSNTRIEVIDIDPDEQVARIGLVHVPADPLDVDPTGAGDAFAAAYVVERSRGQAPRPAAERATQLVHDLLAGLR